MAEKNQESVTLDKIQALMEATEDSLALKMDNRLDGLTLDVATIKTVLDTSSSKKEYKELNEKFAQLGFDLTEVKETLIKNQPIIDNFIASQGKNKVEKKDFGSTWKETIATEFESKKAEFQALTKGQRDAKVTMELKVGAMVIGNVTGDTVATYNQRQGLVPNQKINMRDLLPTTPSPDGLFVTYRETGTSGAIGVQTEAQAKSAIDYSFTEIKTVSHYIAGVVDFTKQLAYALPWLQTTLPRLLLRDFYKKENDYLYSAMQLAATGDNSTTSAANTIEQIIQLIANQEDANFVASYILGKASLWATILPTSKGTAYGLPGGVQINPQTGMLEVTGIPFVKASFADAASLLIWDNDQVERVETETLSVTFSFENEDNFKKNKVTAKVECFEELNVLRPDAIIDTTTS